MNQEVQIKEMATSELSHRIDSGEDAENDPEAITKVSADVKRSLSVVMPVMGSSRLDPNNLPEDPFVTPLPLNIVAAQVSLRRAIDEGSLTDIDFTVRRKIDLPCLKKRMGLIVDALARRVGTQFEKIDNLGSAIPDLNDIRQYLTREDPLTNALIADELRRIAIWQATYDVIFNASAGGELSEHEIGTLRRAVTDKEGFADSILKAAQYTLNNLDKQGCQYKAPPDETSCEGVTVGGVTPRQMWRSTLPKRLVNNPRNVDYAYPIVSGASLRRLLNEYPQSILLMHAGEKRFLNNGEKDSVGGSNTLHGWTRTALTATRRHERKRSRDAKADLGDRLCITDALSGVGALGNKSVLRTLDFYNPPAFCVSRGDPQQGSGPIQTAPAFPAYACDDGLRELLLFHPRGRELYSYAMENVAEPYLGARGDLSVDKLKKELPCDDIALNEVFAIHGWISRRVSREVPEPGETENLIDVFHNNSSGVPIIAHIVKRIEVRAREIYANISRLQ